MTPLYTLNNKLLLTQGKLSTSKDCCCEKECDCKDYPLFKKAAAEIMEAMESDGWSVVCCYHEVDPIPDGPPAGFGPTPADQPCDCQLNDNGIQLRTEYCIGCPEEFCAIAQYPQGFGPGVDIIEYFSITGVGGLAEEDVLPPFFINQLGFAIAEVGGGIEGEPAGKFLVARVPEPVPL